MFKESLGSSDGRVIGYNEGIKLGSIDGKVPCTIFENIDGISLGLHVGTEMVPFDGSIDGSNCKNI